MLEVTGFTILESFRSTFGMLTANLKPLTTVSQELEVSRFSAFQIDYGVLTANFKSLLAVSLYHIREFQIHVWCVNREPQTVDSGFWVGVRRFEIFSVPRSTFDFHASLVPQAANEREAYLRKIKKNSDMFFMLGFHSISNKQKRKKKYSPIPKSEEPYLK